MRNKLSIENIKIDFGTEIIYGCDQTNQSIFSTATFKILTNENLIMIASEMIGMNIADTISFFIQINSSANHKINNFITFYDVNNEKHALNLSESEQNDLWNVLNYQCMEILGKGCDEILDEADGHRFDEERRIMVRTFLEENYGENYKEMFIEEEINNMPVDYALWSEDVGFEKIDRWD